jgi:Flp pilus assembly pilin Flp
VREGMAVTELPVRVLLAVRRAHDAALNRAQSELGASTAQYALLVAFVALVVAVLVGVLGSGGKGLFGSAHTCVHALNRTTTCRVGPVLHGSGAVSTP